MVSDSDLHHFNVVQQLNVTEENHAVDDEVAGRNMQRVRARQARDLFANYSCDNLN
jgi:hypothetical protein